MDIYGCTIELGEFYGFILTYMKPVILHYIRGERGYLF